MMGIGLAKKIPVTMCPICGELKPDNRKTCGKFFCRSEHHTKVMRALFADPEKRRAHGALVKYGRKENFYR